jgi:uncharacterized protein involved in outer membrane biogenesis
VRDLLTGLAVALILLFVAALAGPLLVDWNARRPLVEGELSRALRQRVTVEGPISLRLLPTPLLRLGDVSLGEEADRPALSAETVSLEIAAVALLRGEIRVLDATLEGARLNLRAEKDGVIAPAGGLRPVGSNVPVAVERFLVRRSTILVDDALGGGFLLTGIEVEAQAQALTGPWRVTGRAALNGRPLDIRLSTGAVEPDGSFRTRAALIIDENRRADFDGRVLAGEGAGIDGKVSFAGLAKAPNPSDAFDHKWTAVARAQSSGRMITLDGVEFDSGEETGLKLTGTGSLDLNARTKLTLDLDARALDLDRATGLKDPSLPQVGLRWSSALARNDVSALAGLDLALRIEAPSLVIGNDSLRDLSIKLEREDGELRLARLSAGLPGQSVIEASGTLSLTDDPQFSGPVRLSSRDAPRLLGWALGEPGGRSGRLGTTREATFEGDLSLASALMAARITLARFDESRFSGVIRYGTGGDRPRFEAQLASDGFVIDQLPDLSQAGAALAGTDLSLTLDAGNVRLARVGVGAGRFLLKLDSNRQGLVVERAELTDVAGATVTASGQLGPQGGRLAASVKARRAEPVAELLRRVIANPLTEQLSRRAADLGPLTLDLVAERQGEASAPVTVTLSGDAAGTKLDGSGQLDPAKGFAGLKARLTAENPDVPVLLRQLGADTLPLPIGGAGRLSIDLDQPARRTTVRLDLPGAALTAAVTAETEALAGPLTLEGEDIGPVMQVLGLPVPDLMQRIPVTLSANARLGEAGLGLDALQGRLAGRAIKGKADLALRPAQLKATLAVDALSLADLTGLTLGPIAPAPSGSIWSSQRFMPVPPPLFPVAIDLKADRFDLPLGGAAQNAALVVTLDAERAGLTLTRSDFAGGTLAGAMTLRRNGGRVGVTGTLALRDVPVEALLPERLPLSGRLDIDVDGGATGESLVGFATSLSGAGRLALRDPRLDRFDPRAPLLMATQFDLAPEVPDARRLRDAMARALDAGSFSPQPFETALTLGNGVIKTGAVDIGGPQGRLKGIASLDARNGRFEARGTLVSGEAFAGTPPDIGLLWRYAPGKGLERDIDTAALGNLLTSRAVQRDIERIEAFEADMRERAFFQRRLRAERERRERERKQAEDAAATAEAIRIMSGQPDQSAPTAAP